MVANFTLANSGFMLYVRIYSFGSSSLMNTNIESLVIPIVLDICSIAPYKSSFVTNDASNNDLVNV